MAIRFGWPFRSVAKLFGIKELEARARVAWRVRELKAGVLH
jgi:hypothetical protein